MNAITPVNYPFPTQSSLYFPVIERGAAVVTKTGYMDDPAHKYLLRPSIEDPQKAQIIGLVGSGFNWYDNKTLYQAMEQEIIDAGVPTTNVKVKDSMSYGGARCLREYIFNDVKIEPAVGDLVAFKLFAWNAFDGSMLFRVGAAGQRLACTNGLRIDAGSDITAKKHTKGTTLPGLVEKIKRYIDVFHVQGDRWKKWIGKTISDEDAQAILATIPNASDRLVSQLMEEWHKQRKTTGRTVWTLYNVATYWSSHGEDVRDTGKDNVAFTLYTRENRVYQWANSNEFARLAA